MSEVPEELLTRFNTLQERHRALRRESRSIESDMAALDRVITMLDPNWKVEAVRKTPRKTAGGLFADGELTNLALSTLREGARPMTTADVAATMAEAKGVEPDDARMPEILNRVSAIMAHLVDKGYVVRSGRVDGRAVLWEIDRER